MSQISHSQITWTDKILDKLILPFFPAIVHPNHITLARFLLTPFVLYLLYTNQWIWGLGLFALTAFTDALDGAMARTRRQITSWGKMYDPIADKLLIVLSALIVIPKFFDFLLVFLILLSEAIIIAGAYWLKQTKPNLELSANIWGKAKMFIQSMALVVLILASITAIPNLIIQITELALYGSVGLAIISFIYAGW